MNRFHSCLLTMLAALWTAAATAAPFGINAERDTPASLGCEAAARPTYYTCKSLPAPHPDMDGYILQYEESVGFCMYKGLGLDIRINAFGSAIKSKTDAIADQITHRYGKGKRLDFLQHGSIWNDPQDWAMGLVKEERTYAYLWDVEPAIDTVSAVMVLAKAVNTSTGYVVVELITPQSDACDEKAKAKGASVF